LDRNGQSDVGGNNGKPHGITPKRSFVEVIPLTGKSFGFRKRTFNDKKIRLPETSHRTALVQVNPT